MAMRPNDWRQKTRESLINRLRNAHPDGSDALQQQADATDFQETYLPMIEQLMAQKLRHQFDAQTEAGDFLGYVFEQTDRLRNWDPDVGRFRDYLVGVLSNYRRSSKRRDLTLEHRRSVQSIAPDSDIGDDGAFVQTIARAVDQARAEATVASALERFSRRDPVNAWILSCHYGLPLPGDDPKDTTRWTFARIAARLGITEESARKRKDRSLPRLRKYALLASRELETEDDGNAMSHACERLLGMRGQKER